VTDAPETAHRAPFLQGILPVDRSKIGLDVVAGVTLAALGIPEVMGYTKIAGMPVVTGLYTILVPIAVFAILGSSRHLVVGADSATAAILSAGLVTLAATGSPQYVALAGAAAILTGLLLVLARVARLGFLADFLSRSVLVGFLTGVGIQVAAGQVAGMLGVTKPSGGTVRMFVRTLQEIPDANPTTVWVSVAVLGVILGGRLISKKFPGALIAVIGAIVVSWYWDLAAHGVSTLGPVPGGLPSFGVPDVGWSEAVKLLSTVGALFLVILAQSAATSRAYASKYREDFDENVDLVGLGAANVAAGLSGTFVVNGSPTKTQMVDGAGGKSQLASLTTAAIVLIVLLFLTKPLQYMPNAVLASVVFLIGVELVDVKGMRRIFRMRVDEFVVAAITAVTVVVVGVEQGVLLAIVLSIIDHLRRSYRPNDRVVVEAGPDQRLRSLPVDPASRIVPGLAVYRFGASLYYANAEHFSKEVLAFAGEELPELRWLCIDVAAVGDVDYSGGLTLREVAESLHGRGARLVLCEVDPAVRTTLERYGLGDVLPPDAYFDTIADAVRAFGTSDATG
jgi:SulP family sulfate permease